MPKYTAEEWKQITKDFLLEQCAKINASKNATDPDVMLERLRKENIEFINRMMPEYFMKDN